MDMLVSELRTVVQTLQESHSAISACILELEEKTRNNQIERVSGEELIGKLAAFREKTAPVLE